MDRFLYKHFHPTIDFFRSFHPRAAPTSWSLRLRLLLLQPMVILTNIITHVPYLFRRKTYNQFDIPTRSGSVHAIVYQPSPPADRSSRLRPLHLDIHGGAFVGGNAEADRRFCEHLATTTGTVVVSTDYRLAPIQPFPAAIDDIDDVVAWLHLHAADALGADTTLMTVGGSSAGGNLAFASCLGEGCSGAAATAFKGILTFYAAIDLRLSPWEKPHPDSMPKKDPFRVFLPLYDAYPRLARQKHMQDARLSPVVMDVSRVPDDVLMVIPGIDILVHEQETFVDRIRQESAERHLGKRVEVMKIEEVFHGWMECQCSLPCDRWFC